MICSNLSQLIGFECCPLTEDGSVAMLRTPFRFADGDPIPVFVQTSGSTVRFFDDGRMALHFSGRGLRLDTKRDGRFLSSAAERNGVNFSEEWVLEAIGLQRDAPISFAKYLGAALEISAWERENEGYNADSVLLVDEVASAYLSINPKAQIQLSPEYLGISGKTVELELSVDGVGVAVASTHHASINAALHKIVDVSQSPLNLNRKLRFVIDDRSDPQKAKSEAAILQAAAEVQLLSELESVPAHT